MIETRQNTGSFRSELKRKSIHLLGLAYPLALFWLGLQDFRILLIVFWIVISFIEIVRLSHASFNNWIYEYFGYLLREKEKNRPCGVFWMLSGILFSAFMLDQPMLIATLLLYVVLGDLLASLIGKWCGGPKWFRSEKRLSGSLACFLGCVIIGVLSLRPVYSWHLILLGALVATAAEVGSLSLDDNFSIPVASTILFWFGIPIP